ncbi:hypothetical protein GCM10007978_03590 [Shewanella hanedai]|uniref:Alpha/beta hydrolase n=1 Tax=Shewanella hanedai TaxID=25 RepID=A0A553JU54_SHEHA|nr:alpha/beta hydrolase [Shewanella hanedai]TRY15970.1 hypothetical protein FN961_03060 [Shewanella hanedai]GGI69109.1 hypothetical protein GCM10007978_03590 [Shewanella hanedai]
MGEGEPESTIVFVHGNPESSYTYSRVRDEIIRNSRKTCRIIAMDHIGFGLSDQASHEMVDAQGFPFKCLSWNTIGYRTPWRLWRHIAPMVMESPAGQWCFFKHVFNYIARALSGGLTDNEKVYRDIFSTRANSLSSQRNVKQTKVWGHGYYYTDPVLGHQDNFEFYKNMQRKITACWGPSGQNIGVRYFLGLWDPLARLEVQQQWLEALPQVAGHIRTYEDVGHFVEEHKYVDIAAGIIDTAQLG